MVYAADSGSGLGVFNKNRSSILVYSGLDRIRNSADGSVSVAIQEPQKLINM